MASDGGVDILVERWRTRNPFCFGPKGIPHLCFVKGPHQVCIPRGNIPGGPNVGSVAHVRLIKRVIYTIIICTDLARGETVALEITMIINGHNALLHGEVGQLLANVDA